MGRRYYRGGIEAFTESQREEHGSVEVYKERTIMSMGELPWRYIPHSVSVTTH